MDTLQCFFILTTALSAFGVSLLGVRERDLSVPLLGYFAVVACTVAMVLFGFWPWNGETYFHEELARASLAALFMVESGWQLGLPRRQWRELLFRACCAALSAGVFGYLLTLMPRGVDGWGLRALVGLHLGVAGMLAEVGRQEALSDFRQTAVRWLFIMAVADAVNVAAAEAGPYKTFADWFGVIAWCGLCLMVCISAFESGSGAKPRPTPPR